MSDGRRARVAVFGADAASSRKLAGKIAKLYQYSQ